MAHQPPHQGSQPPPYGQFPQQFSPYTRPIQYPQVVVPSPSYIIQQQYANHGVYSPQQLQRPPPPQYSQPPPSTYYPPSVQQPPYSPAPVPQPSPPAPLPQFIEPHRLSIQPVPPAPPVQPIPPKPKEATKLKEKPSPPFDFQALLLSLAEEYLEAAHGLGTVNAFYRDDAGLDEYYKLIAAGLKCMQAALKNPKKLPPKTEALVRLRYARTIFEETDNDAEAEEALDKGITLCKQNRLLDLQYSMQLLLARVLYRSKPKAALKRLDSMIQDVETYKHTQWEYTFRFLRITLSLSSSHQDTTGAIHNLQKITTLSKRTGDRAIFVLSSIFQALTYLRSSNTNAIEEAQRALASARSQQLSLGAGDLPQMNALMSVIDISCSLQENDIFQSVAKTQAMQEMMDGVIEDRRWRDDGYFFISFASSASSSAGDGKDEQEMDRLRLSWLPKVDVYSLCYLLSSMATGFKNSHDGNKAEKYVFEGLRMIRGAIAELNSVPESLATAGERLLWRKKLLFNFLLQLAFLLCSRTAWASAADTMTELRKAASDLGSELPDLSRSLLEYLSGVIAQGTGDIKTACAAYQSPYLALPSPTTKPQANDAHRDLAILAALNKILILRDPSHPQHYSLNEAIASVAPHCNATNNKYIKAANYLVRAALENEITLHMKHDLQHALEEARRIGNQHIMGITITLMSWRYFRGVISEQAEKSARAGRATAEKASNRLWMSVTNEMLGETLEKQGKGPEAMMCKREAARIAAELPEKLRRTRDFYVEI